jgi:hypothetical protein
LTRKVVLRDGCTEKMDVRELLTPGALRSRCVLVLTLNL